MGLKGMHLRNDQNMERPNPLNLSSKLLAKQIRLDTLAMVHAAKSSHVGSGFSIADILAVLYATKMAIDPLNAGHPQRDRLIISKGHAAAAVYACLANVGLFDRGDLASYGQPGSVLMAHVNHKVKGVEVSTGALGHGLPFGVGKALAGKRLGAVWRVFVLLSDGEMDEGSNWEALMFAAHARLDNLVAIVDYNKLQSLGSTEATLGLEPLADKVRAFNWNLIEVDGHDHGELVRVLDEATENRGRPTLILAHTTKGKGVSFMENAVSWHYKSPNDDELAQALNELQEVCDA